MSFFVGAVFVISRAFLYSFVLLSFLLAPFIGHAQSSLTGIEHFDRRWAYHDFTQDANLTNKSVFDFDFDQEGALWAAASDGLYHYDGYQWKQFTTEDGLPSDFVRCVLVASDKKLWVGTDKGAGVFDGSQFLSLGPEDGLSSQSVRRIRETKNGAIWFCCDRWPDINTAGGAVRLLNGQWSTYTLESGLPNDHVMDVFEDSQSRLFFLTASGIYQLSDDEWLPIISPSDFDGDLQFWSMAETEQGDLIASTHKGIYQFANDEWTFYADINRSEVYPFIVPQLVVYGDDLLSFLPTAAPNEQALHRFVDGSFSPIEDSQIDVGDLFNQQLKAAPDGSVWGCGDGFIFRAFPPELLTMMRYAQFPPSAFLDNRDQLWFIGDDAHIRLVDEEWSEWRNNLGAYFIDSESNVWNYDLEKIVLQKQTTEVQYLFTDLGLSQIDGHLTGNNGHVWLYGTGPQGNRVLLHFDGGSFQRVESELLEGKDFSSGLVTEDGNLFIIFSTGQQNQYAVLKVSSGGQQVNAYSLSALFYGLPSLFSDAANSLWIYQGPVIKTYDYEMNPIDRDLGFLDDSMVRYIFKSDHCLWFPCSGQNNGELGIFRLDGDQIKFYPTQSAVNFGEQLYDGSIFLGALGALFQIDPSLSKEPIQYLLSKDDYIYSVNKDAQEHLWVGYGEDIFHVINNEKPPDTEVVSEIRQVVRGEQYHAQCAAIAYMKPRGYENNITFSWKYDDAPWSEFERVDDFVIVVNSQNYSLGRHTLYVRSRDQGLKIDPTPASLSFTILPLPIQQQPWFAPAISALFIFIVFLCIFTTLMAMKLKRSQRLLAHHSLNLEKTVGHQEQEIGATKQMLQLILNSVPDFIFWKDRNCVYIGCNQNFAVVAGVGSPNEIIGKTDYELAWKKEEADFFIECDRRVMDSNTPELHLIEPQLQSNGKHAWLDTNKIPLHDQDGNVIGVLGTYEDITEKMKAEKDNKKLQSDLEQSRKIESVGRLAGGVAHDFNNMLSVILGHSELAIGQVKSSDMIYVNLQEIMKAAKHSAELTRQLLAFARKQTISPKVVNLNETVDSMMKMLKRLIGEDINLVWAPGAPLWLVRVDPTQLDQIMINLCVNARDAIKGVGKVTIETNNQPVDDESCADKPGFIAGDYVRLSVTDNGVGMSNDIVNQIFEPFFTTKKTGKGTGLGLATIYGIVKQNNGYIDVDSEEGEGSCFTIYLPRYQGETVHKNPAASIAENARGTETVLLVEDEPALLELTTQIVNQLGYHTLTADSPDEALKVVSEYNGEIHLLLTDVIMPEMNGRELAKRLGERYPGVKLLFMSGYTSDVIAHHGILDDDVVFIQKPFTASALSIKLREALNQ
ncbi:MAG: ATP-binding protein [Candidatus Hinthialibacter antarcticus]|nr:ATP-binding protein [Candidatus Hinthialibacter antarcticus]